MAESRTMLEQIGLTRSKAALIGVLAIALGGIIYSQYGPAGDDDAAPTAAETTHMQPADPPVTADAAPANVAEEPTDTDLQFALAELDETRWQTAELTQVIAYDPFALPEAFPQPPRSLLDPRLAADGADLSAAAENAKRLAEAVERLQQQLEELQQRGVHVIIGERDQYAAMIGDRTLYVGDEINGFTVMAIEPDGVRVERKGVE